jgi:uncharacterized protein YcnI
MMKLNAFNAAAGLALSLCVPFAAAHIGVVNTQLSFAREGTYELVLAVPHGCAVPGTSPAVETDTYKVEVTTPVAFGSPRAIVDGVFGVPLRTANPDGTTTFVWTKLGNGSSSHFDAVGQADNQSYRIAVRGSFKATTTSEEGARFTTQRFNAKQYCKNPAAGQPDLFTDWANYSAAGDNQSPAVKVYPTRLAGWNAYTLPASVAATLTTPAAVSTFVKAYFGDAQIAWVGKAGYSPNADTTARIQALVAKDSSYSELVNKSSLSASETLWVKY